MSQSIRALQPGPAVLTLLFTLLSSMASASESDLFSGLKARALGPAAVSGRIAALDVVASDPNHIVVGAATGGVWISENGGLNWTPVFDDEAVASIGALAIQQSNPDVIWVGTGEGNTRNSTSIGGGIYKSIDGGRTWNLMGLEKTERIHRIAIHPTRPEIVYVAALGTLWGPNTDRGIYKTEDGGETWTRILYRDENSGGTDVRIDPFNPNKVYASLWEHRRWPYYFNSGGPGSGLYISWDGGETWHQKTEEDGLPAGDLGRISFAPSAAQPDRVYALVEAKKSAMLRSDDGGMTWVRTNEDPNVAVRPFYYNDVTADPQNPDRVYTIASRLSVSIDGGKTFEFNPVIDCCAPSNTVHIDNHAFWVNPNDPKHLVIGNDGGIAISRDRGETWRYVRNLPLSQFYHVAVDNDHPYNVYGGLQDNGSWRGPSEVWENAGIRNLHWQEVAFGDGFDTLPDPANSRQGYAMSQGGFLVRWNLDTGEQKLIRPPPPSPGDDLRFNWNAGLAQDPFDEATIYYGSQYLHKSTDRGDSWTAISGDLTSNGPEMQKARNSGGLTPDVTAAEYYNSIVAVAPSPVAEGTIWVGTDDGRVQVTRNGGEDWERIDTRARGVPEGTWVPMIAASPHDAGTAFVVFDDHRRSNMKPYLFRVTDHGRKWESLIDDSISGYALSVLQDPVDPDLLFLGTEFGLYISLDAGNRWMRFTEGLPTVSVMDMAIQQREVDLVLGTHGRSIYVIDDYSALRNLSADDLQQRLKILSASPGQQYKARQTPSTRFTGSGEFRADNEPYGVMVTFVANGEELPHPDQEKERSRRIEMRRERAAESVDEEPGEDSAPKVLMRVSDQAGTVIRSYRYPLVQGVNRLVWPMTRDGIRPMPGAEPAKLDDGLPPGPQVPPGQYTISLSLEDETGTVAESSTAVEVLRDPRISASDADLQASYEAQVALMEMRSSAVSAVEQIVNTRKDIDIVTGLIKQLADEQDNESFDALTEQAGAVRARLDELELLFRTPPDTRGIIYDEDKVSNMIGTASFYLGGNFDAPSPTAEIYAGRAADALARARQELGRFMSTDMAEFKAAVEAAGIGLFRSVPPAASG